MGIVKLIKNVHHNYKLHAYIVYEYTYLTKGNQNIKGNNENNKNAKNIKLKIMFY